MHGRTSTATSTATATATAAAKKSKAFSRLVTSVVISVLFFLFFTLTISYGNNNNNGGMGRGGGGIEIEREEEDRQGINGVLLNPFDAANSIDISFKNSPRFADEESFLDKNIYWPSSSSSGNNNNNDQVKNLLNDEVRKKIPANYWKRLRTLDEEGIQMSYEQYSLLSITLFAYSPLNALIFSVGHDSFIYYWANKGGRTVFLENIPKWITTVKMDMAKQENISMDDLEVYLVQYTTASREGATILRNVNYSRLNEFQYPKEVLDYDGRKNDQDNRMWWDFILVDGPYGHIHGRFQSIYCAYRLARNRLYHDIFERNITDTIVHVFIHDAERSIERHYSDVFLGNSEFYVYLNRTYPSAKARGHMRYYQCNQRWLRAILANEKEGFNFPFVRQWR